MEFDRQRHLDRQLAKIGGERVGSAEWLDERPELVAQARALFETGLARIAARDNDRSGAA